MKRTLFNFVALTTLAVLILFGLTSCTTITPPATGIVTIDLDIESVLGVELTRPSNTYYIYLDDTYQGAITSSEFLTIADVSIGDHSFEAYNYLAAGVSFNLCDNGNTKKGLKLPVNGYIHCSGMVSYVVAPGVNYVTIPVTCGSIIITLD